MVSTNALAPYMMIACSDPYVPPVVCAEWGFGKHDCSHVYACPSAAFWDDVLESAFNHLASNMVLQPVGDERKEFI
jgi:hypothetical protein